MTCGWSEWTKAVKRMGRSHSTLIHSGRRPMSCIIPAQFQDRYGWIDETSCRISASYSSHRIVPGMLGKNPAPENNQRRSLYFLQQEAELRLPCLLLLT